MLMSVVRSADINRTPDVRTRAIVQHWACLLRVRFIRPKLTERAVALLLAGAGLVAGVGDWRQEKGSGNFGQFELVDADDKRVPEIMRSGRRVDQDRALKDFTFYDEETERLFEWSEAERRRRGRDRVVVDEAA